MTLKFHPAFRTPLTRLIHRLMRRTAARKETGPAFPLTPDRHLRVRGDLTFAQAVAALASQHAAGPVPQLVDLDDPREGVQQLAWCENFLAHAQTQPLLLFGAGEQSLWDRLEHGLQPPVDLVLDLQYSGNLFLALQHLRKDARDGLSQLALHPAAQVRLDQHLQSIPLSEAMRRNIKDPACSVELDFRVWELLWVLHTAEPGWGVIITARGSVLWPFVSPVSEIRDRRA